MNGNKPTAGKYISFFMILFLAADFSIWWSIFRYDSGGSVKAFFLDVGQGDAELVIFPDKVKVLTDAGPDSRIIGELEKIAELGDKYIDIAVISHPQLDHFNGFRYVLDHYKVGAFIYNGRSGDPNVEEWQELISEIKDKNIPLVALKAGDSIRNSGNKIDFLSPNELLLQSAELNDTGLVEFINSLGFKILLTADIGAETEKYLAKNFDLNADILKVAHHGSRFSSSEEFLAAVNPKVAVIEVAKRNNYGHPAQGTIQKLKSASAAVFRTDESGQIAAYFDGNKIKVFIGK